MPQLHQAEAQIAIAWPVSCALARTICGVCSVVRVHRHGRRCGRFWLIASTARPCSSPVHAVMRTGDGTFGGLLAASTWPTTFGGPNGRRISRLELRDDVGFAFYHDGGSVTD
jgi:hypothetical protein